MITKLLHNFKENKRLMCVNKVPDVWPSVEAALLNHEAFHFYPIMLF